MDPKPVQRPHPRVYYGGISAAGARVAARRCDGFYPTFTDPLATADRYREVLAALPDQLGQVDRSTADFSLLCVVSARVDDAMTGPEFGKGSASKLLDDLAALAAEGFSLAVLHLDTSNGSQDEWLRQLDMVGEQIIGPAASLASAGRWRAA